MVVLQRVMACSAVAEAQGSSRAQIRSPQQNGFTARSKSRASAANQSDAPRFARRSIKAGRIGAANDRKFARRRSERAHSAGGHRPLAAPADAACASPGLTTTEGRADNFSLDINSVTAA